MPEARKSPGRKFGALLRHYTRGILGLILVVLCGRLLWTILPRESVDRSVQWLSGGADRWVLAVLGILILPPLVGWAAGLLLRPLLQRYRGLRSLLQVEESLVTEFAPDETRGFPVVVVEWPRPDVRTIGLLTSSLAATENGGELAAVFLPRGPDPLKGYIHIISREKLRVTDWTVKEYLAYQMSYGAAVPHPVSLDTGTSNSQP